MGSASRPLPSPDGCHSRQRRDAVSASPCTSRAKKPTLSKEGANGITPSMGTRLKVGLKPGMPQNAAGRITEPIVCEPRASGQKPAATEAAEPLLDPPGV